MPSWNKTFLSSTELTNQWIEFFKILFDKEYRCIIDLQSCLFEQLKYGGDIEIQFWWYPSTRIELKTRAKTYHEYFKNDKLVVIEDRANIEQNKQGSSIWNSKADIWANGYNVDNILMDPFAYWTVPCKEFLERKLIENPNYYTYKTTHTDKLYHTGFYLVPIEDLKEFQVRLPYF